MRPKIYLERTIEDQEIIHMIIKKYFINGNTYSLFDESLQCDYLGLEIQFKSISNQYYLWFEWILENYQIKITKYLDGTYVKSNFDEDKQLAEMSYRVLSGYNQNEVMFVPKTTKKLAFFEKFFQLFS